MLRNYKLIEIPYFEENLISYDYIMHKAGYWFYREEVKNGFYHRRWSHRSVEYNLF